MSELISLLTDSLSRITRYPYVVLVGTIASIVSYYSTGSVPIAIGKGLTVAGSALMLLELSDLIIALSTAGYRDLDSIADKLAKGVLDGFFLLLLGCACIKLSMGCIAFATLLPVVSRLIRAI